MRGALGRAATGSLGFIASEGAGSGAHTPGNPQEWGSTDERHPPRGPTVRRGLFGSWATSPVHLRGAAHPMPHPGVIPGRGTNARPLYGFGSRMTRWSLTMGGQVTNHDEDQECLGSVGSCTAMTLQRPGSVCTRGS